MKTLLVVFASLAVYSAQCQTKTFQNVQAIKQQKVTFYDAEGYSIFLQELDYNMDEKGLNKIKRKYSVAKNLPVTEDSSLPGVKILSSADTKISDKATSTYYLSQTKDGKTRVVGFNTFCDRDKDIEITYYQAIVNDLLPVDIFTPSHVDTIQFAGRPIALGAACRWMDVRNIQCPNMGQMNWSEFSSPERAKQMIDGQKKRNSEMKMGNVIEESEIDIIFEGAPVKASKRKLKIKIPKLIMGGSNILIIYYVTAEVRGRYVACVLSHYTDDIGAERLPPLLSEVMHLIE